MKSKVAPGTEQILSPWAEPCLMSPEGWVTCWGGQGHGSGGILDQAVSRIPLCSEDLPV